MAFEAILGRLSRSAFRSRFKLSQEDLLYVRKKGLETIEDHARDFISRRLKAEVILNDGKQTPFKGHPVFKAQHATATCCRGCLKKWHHIPAKKALRQEDEDFIVALIMAWIKQKALL